MVKVQSGSSTVMLPTSYPCFNSSSETLMNKALQAFDKDLTQAILFLQSY